MPRTNRPSRIDGNQGAIAKALERAGAAVHDTHELGDGFPDLCVGLAGRILLLEVKDPSKPPSKRKLTDRELEFHILWRDAMQLPVYVVETPEAALALAGLAPVGGTGS